MSRGPSAPVSATAVATSASSSASDSSAGRYVSIWRGLLGLGVGEVVAAVLAIDALGLAAALALAAQDGDLVARALLGVLLEL